MDPVIGKVLIEILLSPEFWQVVIIGCAIPFSIYVYEDKHFASVDSRRAASRS